MKDLNEQLKFSKELHSIIDYYIKNEEDKQDIYQEAFLKIYEASKNYQEKGRMKAWLSKIVRNICLDYLRKKKSQQTFIDKYKYHVCNNVDSNVNTKLVCREVLANFIDRLLEISVPTRDEIVLRDYYCKRNNKFAISKKMKISRKLVKCIIDKNNKILNEDVDRYIEATAEIRIFLRNKEL